MQNKNASNRATDSEVRYHDGQGLDLHMDTEAFMTQFAEAKSLLVRMTDRTIVASSNTIGPDKLMQAYRLHHAIHDMGEFMSWPVPAEQKEIFSGETSGF